MATASPKSDALACILVRGQLTLAELEPEYFGDPKILAQCDKVTCEADPESAYPKYFSGEVSVTLSDGRELTHREQINRGADKRPLSAEEITAKFRANADGVVPADKARDLFDMTSNVATLSDLSGLGAILSARSGAK